MTTDLPNSYYYAPRRNVDGTFEFMLHRPILVPPPPAGWENLRDWPAYLRSFVLRRFSEELREAWGPGGEGTA